MKRLRSLSLLALLALALAGGCGTSTDTVGSLSSAPPVTPSLTPAPSVSPSPSPTPAFGSVQVQFVLQRAVPQTVTRLRFTCTDTFGQEVFGPITQAKASQVILSPVPTTAVQIQIDYLDSTGRVVGVYRGPLNFAGTAGPIIINDPNFEDVTTLKSLTVQPLNAQLALGLTQEFRATGVFTDGTIDDLTTAVAWSPSNATVATINSTGVASALSLGAANVSASLNNLTGSANLTVVNASFTKLEILPGAVVGLQVPLTQQLQARITLTDGTVQNVTNDVLWRASSSAVSVNKEGLMRANQAGQVLVSATFGASGLNATCNVATTGPAVFNLSVTPTNVQINRFKTAQLTVKGTFGDGSVKDVTNNVTWKSSLPSLAAVSSTGLVTGLFPGSAVISASLGTAASTQTNVTVVDFNPPPGSSPTPPLGPSPSGSPIRSDLNTGLYPAFLLATDLNGDGKPDLAVTQEDLPPSVGVFLNQGGAQFSARTDYTVELGALSLASGVFRGPGLVDILVPTFLTGDVDSLQNDGTGKFPVKTSVFSGCTPFGVATADFYNDGGTDVVVSDIGDNSCTVAKNVGGGLVPTGFFPTGNLPVQCVTGDLDKKNGPDVVVANFLSRSLTVALNDGSGGWSITRPRLGYGVLSVALADFNGDGNLDLVAVNNFDGTVTVALGDGQGNFAPQTPIATGNVPMGVATGDFDGDGKQDFVVCNELDNTAQILLGRGDGTFQTGGTYAVGESPAWIVAADFNGDGRADFATANPDDNTITIWVNVR